MPVSVKFTSLSGRMPCSSSLTFVTSLKIRCFCCGIALALIDSVSHQKTAIVVTVCTGEDELQKAILVVDDDPVALQWFEAILSESGHSVITSRDGQSALIAIREGLHADLIITDYRMPGMDGLELVAKLKTYAPEVPVIMCSLYVRTDIYLKALALGVVEYLEKPVREKHLKQVIVLALGAQRQEQHRNGKVDNGENDGPV
jgi:CheY-like chemotaxis protein